MIVDVVFCLTTQEAVMKMLSSAFGFHAVTEWRAPAALR